MGTPIAPFDEGTEGEAEEEAAEVGVLGAAVAAAAARLVGAGVAAESIASSASGTCLAAIMVCNECSASRISLVWCLCRLSSLVRRSALSQCAPPRSLLRGREERGGHKRERGRERSEERNETQCATARLLDRAHQPRAAANEPNRSFPATRCASPIIPRNIILGTGDGLTAVSRSAVVERLES